MFHTDKSQAVWEKVAKELRAENYAMVDALLEANIAQLRKTRDDLRLLYYLSVRVPDAQLERIIDRHYAEISRQEQYRLRVGIFMQAIETAKGFDPHLTPAKVQVLHNRLMH